MLAVCVWALVSTASGDAGRSDVSNRHLARAEHLIDNLRYPSAAKELELTLATEGLDRTTLLRALELSGIVAAILNQPAQATAFFRTLLVLDPKHKLSADFAPRVTTIFYQAKGWIAERGPLNFSPGEVRFSADRVTEINVWVRPDPLSLGKRVRFHSRYSNGSWTTTEVNFSQEDTVVLSANAESVEWWAELLGDSNAVLASIGSQRKPMLAHLPPPPPPPPEPVAAAKMEPHYPPPSGGAIEAIRPVATSPLRIASYGLAGGGIAALSIGAYFGWKSMNDRRRIEFASVNSQGIVTGISQREAFELDKQARLEATLANILWISGSALAASGVVLYFVGGHAAVAPAAGGISFQGALP